MRFELTTPCLQGRCNNHYATPAYIENKKILYLIHVGFEPTTMRIITFSISYYYNHLLKMIW